MSAWNRARPVAVAVVLVIAALGICGPELQAQEETSALLRLRILDPAVRRAVSDGIRRSKTFRNLIDAIERSGGFVYIVQTPYLPGRLDGCVDLDVGGSGPNRYVRIMVKAGLDFDRLIAVIGHEAQHVLEVLEEPQGFSDGRRPVAGASRLASRQYETRAAVDAERRIVAELRQDMSRPAATPRLVIVYSDPTVTKAVALLEPSPTASIRLFDPAKAKGDARRLRDLRAGVTSAVTEVCGKVILVSTSGRWYRAAAAGDDFALHAFASELAHEEAHATGCQGEREAYARHIDVFRGFMAKGAVDRGRGERFLQELRVLMARYGRKE